MCACAKVNCFLLPVDQKYVTSPTRILKTHLPTYRGMTAKQARAGCKGGMCETGTSSRKLGSALVVLRIHSARQRADGAKR